MELGTLEHPFRTMKAATFEILTLWNNMDVEVTVFIKDVYLGESTVYFINTTKVTFERHPDYALLDRRALLTFTTIDQDSISEKAAFHLFNTTELDVQAAVDKGSFSEGELQTISQAVDPIFAHRSSVAFKNIDLYREQIDFALNSQLIHASYLQEKYISFGRYTIW